MYLTFYLSVFFLNKTLIYDKVETQYNVQANAYETITRPLK